MDFLAMLGGFALGLTSGFWICEALQEQRKQLNPKGKPNKPHEHTIEIKDKNGKVIGRTTIVCLAGR